jgi:hypothetical protein
VTTCTRRQRAVTERCLGARAYNTQSHLQGSGRQATNRPPPGSPSRVTQLPQRLVPVNLDTQKAPHKRGNTLATDVRRDQGQGQPGSHCLSPRPSRGFPRRSVPTDYSEVSTATHRHALRGQSADSPCTSYLNPAASCWPSMPSSRQPPGRLSSIPPFVRPLPTATPPHRSPPTLQLPTRERHQVRGRDPRGAQGHPPQGRRSAL